MRTQFYKTEKMNLLMSLLTDEIGKHLQLGTGDFSNRWNARELGEKIMGRLDEEGWIKVYE